jgi:hypothetical protein
VGSVTTKKNKKARWCVSRTKRAKTRVTKMSIGNGNGMSTVHQAVIVDEGAFSALYLDGKLVAPVDFLEDLVKALDGKAVTLEWMVCLHDNLEPWPVNLSELMEGSSNV